MADLFSHLPDPAAEAEAARERLESLGWERVPTGPGPPLWLHGGRAWRDDQALAWLRKREHRDEQQHHTGGGDGTAEPLGRDG